MQVGLFCHARRSLLPGNISRAHKQGGGRQCTCACTLHGKRDLLLAAKETYFSPQKRPTHANRAGSVNIRVPGAKNEYLVKAHILLNFCFVLSILFVFSTNRTGVVNLRVPDGRNEYLVQIHNAKETKVSNVREGLGCRVSR